MNLKLISAMTLVVLGTLLPMTVAASGRGDANLCVKMSAPEQQKPCGGSAGKKYTMKLTNSCAEPIDVRFCMLRDNGKWSCGLRPNFISPDVVNTQTCDGTGQGWAAARWAGEKGRMLDPNDGVATGTGDERGQVCDQLRSMPGSTGPCTCSPVGPKVRCVVANSQKPEQGPLDSAKSKLRDYVEDLSAEENKRCEASPDLPNCKRPNRNGGSGVRG